jgi:nitroreductase
MTDPMVSRTSVRSYQKKPVEKGKIELMLRAAMQAPSAVNQQPWFFAVVENDDLKRRLSECSPYAQPAKEAPVLFVVCRDTSHLILPEDTAMDLSAAAMSLLLEAEVQGLGAVWLGIAPEKDRMDAVAKVLNLPAHIEPFCLIPCGYPAEKPAAKPRFDAAKVQYFA